MQKLPSIPYLQPQDTQKNTLNTRLNFYLAANGKALRLLDQDYITYTLHATLSYILGKVTQPVTLNLNLKDPTHLDNNQAYKDPYPSIPSTPTINVPEIRTYLAEWNPTDFIHTNGSMVKGNTTLGASIVSPRTHPTTHI